MSVVGEAFVRVRPDTRGFESEAKTGLRSSFIGIGKAVAGFAAAYATVDFAREAIGQAAAVQKAQESIRAEFGRSGHVITDFADGQAASLGLAKSAVDTSAASYGILFKNLGIGHQAAATMTTNIFRLAGAMGAIKNQDPAQALDALRLALAGNTRGLKAFGIVVDTTSEKQQALKMGLIDNVNQALTPGIKAQAIYGLATAHLGEFMDQARAHSGDLTNQMRVLHAEFLNVADEVGTALLPAVTSIVVLFGRVLPPTLSAVADALEVLSAQFRSAFDAIASLPSVRRIVAYLQYFAILGRENGVSRMLDAMRDSFNRLSPAAKGAVVIVTALVAAFAGFILVGAALESPILALAALAAGADYAYTHFAGFRRVVNQLAEGFQTRLLPVIQQVATVIFAEIGRAVIYVQAHMPEITRAVVGAFRSARDAVLPILTGLRGIIMDFVHVAEFIWAHFASYIVTQLRIALTLIRENLVQWGRIIEGIFSLIADILHGRWGAAWDDIKQIVAASIRIIANTLRAARATLANLAEAAGHAIYLAVRQPLSGLAGYVGGIFHSIGDAISRATGYVIGKVQTFVNRVVAPVNWVLGHIGLSGHEIPTFGSGGVASSSGGRPHTPHFASGGVVGPGETGIYRPVPGGMLKMVEAGHPEAVVSLDPTHKRRSLEIINEILNSLGVLPQAAAGMIPQFAGGGIGAAGGNPRVDAFDPVTGAARSAVSSIGSSVSSAYDLFSNPVGFLKRYMPSIPTAPGMLGTLLEGVSRYMVNQVLGWVDKHKTDGIVGGALAEAHRMTALHRPYLWGGGHGGWVPGGPWDCSGAVSQILHTVGLLGSPEVSGALMSWGKAGSGMLEVLANPEHTYMRIAGQSFGTSNYNPGGGFGGPLPYGERSGFAIRHALNGGVVPGAPGSPQLTVTHGQETITPYWETKAEGGMTINGDVYLSPQSDQPRLMFSEMDRLVRRSRL